MKNKSGKIIGLIVCLILCTFISCSIYFSPYHQIERYYYGQKEQLNQIVQTFRNLYTDSVASVEYSLEEHSLIRNGENTKDIVDYNNDNISSILEDLQNQYQSHSDYSPVFDTVNAVYDNSGNMLLYLVAQRKAISKESNTSRFYYLVYIDNGYSGHGSGLAIDKSDITRKPFSDNWYTWSKDVPLG